MPRMRPATCSGRNSSSASSFSPRPTKRIGLPVTARIDSAAPPRPSPSMRVRRTPEMPTRPSNCSATLTASWPVRPSTTSSVSCGWVGVADRGDLGHQLVVDVEAAGGVEHDDVVAAERGLLPARASRSPPGPGRGRSAGCRRRPGCRGSPAAASPPGGGCRARPSAPACPRAPSSGGRASRWSWSCPSPAGRPSAPGRAASRSEGGRRAVAAEHADELVVHDLHDLLAGGDRLGDGLAAGLLLDAA